MMGAGSRFIVRPVSFLGFKDFSFGILFVRSFYTCFGSPSVTGLLGSPLLRCSLYLPPSFVANFTSLLSLYTGRSDSLTPTSSGLSTPVSVNSTARFNAGTGLGGLTGSSSG